MYLNKIIAIFTIITLFFGECFMLLISCDDKKNNDTMLQRLHDLSMKIHTSCRHIGCIKNIVLLTFCNKVLSYKHQIFEWFMSIEQLMRLYGAIIEQVFEIFCCQNISKYIIQSYFWLKVVPYHKIAHDPLRGQQFVAVHAILEIVWMIVLITFVN